MVTALQLAKLVSLSRSLSIIPRLPQILGSSSLATRDSDLQRAIGADKDLSHNSQVNNARSNVAEEVLVQLVVGKLLGTEFHLQSTANTMAASFQLARIVRIPSLSPSIRHL